MIEDCRLAAEMARAPRFPHRMAETIEITSKIFASVISEAPIKFCHFRHSAGFRLIRSRRMGLDGVLQSR